MCLAHGIQLAVVEVIYKKKACNKETEVSFTDLEDDNEDQEALDEYQDQQEINFIETNIEQKLSDDYNLNCIIS